MKKIVALCLLFLIANVSFSWNKVGHELVAYIAYEHITPQTKKTVQHYLDATNRIYRQEDFVHVSTWLDRIRYLDMHWYDNYHYIDIPLGNNVNDGKVDSTNVLTGIEKSIAILNSRYTTSFDKGMAIRILIHLVGDAHQPLHTASKYSEVYPDGDKGGNLYPIDAKPLAKNLHQFWDNGGGLFYRLNKTRKQSLYDSFDTIDCDSKDDIEQPINWIRDAHKIAQNTPYLIQENEKPSQKYISLTKDIAKSQIEHAGCRLANLLNTIFSDKKTR